MTGTVARRALVLRAVEAVPGAHLRSLQRITHLAWGTLRYHAGVLVDQGYVSTEADRRFLRYYPAAMPKSARRTWDAIRTRQTRLILETLLDAPLGRNALASRLHLAPSTAHRYVTRLKALGLLDDADGALCVAWPEEARRLLDGINPTFLDHITDGAIGLFDQLDP